MYIILEKYSSKYLQVQFTSQTGILDYNAIIKTPEFTYHVFIYIFKHEDEGNIQPGPERLSTVRTFTKTTLSSLKWLSPMFTFTCTTVLASRGCVNFLDARSRGKERALPIFGGPKD